MNVYDFDGTIYNGDSSLDFYCFCLKRYPLLIRVFPRQLLSYYLYKLEIINKLRFKEVFFSFLQNIDNIDQEVVIFWDLHINKIKKWYFDKQEYSDVIISASPHFLLQELCKRIGVNDLIATEVDKNSGKFLSKNCFGEEKIKRFYEKFPNATIDAFYFDSISDLPLASVAKASYIVKGNFIEKIEFND